MKTYKCHHCKKIQPSSKFKFSYAQRCDDCKEEKKKSNKRELFTAYGDGRCACVCCGETELAFLTIDHIGGKKTRMALGHVKGNTVQKLRKNGFPHKDKLRTLCMQCNFVTRWGNMCPHQSKGYVVKGL